MSNELDKIYADYVVRTTTVVVATILFTTSIGIWAGIVNMNDLGTAVTWVWLGIGFAALYLLYRIAISVEMLRHTT
ncbi:Mn2+/Fe2+ transporter [Halostagnicola sp. A-GB9-2]|uniref:Mn2+/Fe2+ transporter n=1 Tax=Halostagnicola sp. A-GB9-2 TaxID=3048066 RepID=UPI0024BF1D34|nr:Mn2+/Fe2+ transporter [Halostagnicola sp. A-GB9-2]MDJ1433907.1 Mn2+/Fe2+ transporter [Halostagnicola sp. A-GB9-2]